MKKDSLTIGIPIRNEELSLPMFIKTLEIALILLIKKFPDLSLELVFCLNDTTDKSEEVLKFNLPGVVFKNSKIIYSKQGKVNAIIEIIKQKKLTNGYVCFIDADVELDKFCLVNLYLDLHQDTNLFLVYSSVFPKYNQKKSLIQKVQRVHYILRCDVSPRNYFHGRAYIMRSDIIFDNLPRKLPNYFWNLDDGPCVDDIYLSRLIVHFYGLASIKESKNSKLWFLPPKSLKDFYFGQRRLLLEIKRLNLLYPEHAYIQDLYFCKKILWYYFFKINPKYLLSYLTYYFLEEIVRIVVKIEIVLISLKILKCKKIWKPLKTTKKWKI